MLFTQRPIFSKIERGKIKGEHLYRALGQTDKGRHMVAFFIYKATHEALIVSARDMTEKEKKYYARKR